MTGSLFLALSSTALAAGLPAPILNGTNPTSPGASLTPRIQGQVEEAGTKSITAGAELSLLGASTRATEPTNTVKVYAETGCGGAVVAEGTLALLEGEGIQVTVAAESTTTFFATQSDGVETSSCSAQGLSYRQVSSAPAQPTFTSVSPESPADYNFPLLLGSADPEATVSIYTNSACTAGPVASGAGAEFEATGIQVSVADNSETTFYAKAAMAGYASACSSSSITYVEVTPPPAPGGEEGGEGGGESGGGGGGGTETSGGGGTTPPSVAPAVEAAPATPRLRTVPGGWANDNTPVVTGSAPGAATVRIYTAAGCAGPPVASGSADALAAGIPVQVVNNVVVAFYAVSVGPTGLKSECSAPVYYGEDSLAPRIRITMAPAGKTRKRKAVIRFTDITGDTPGTVFRCRVNRKKWRKCSSPLRLKHLKRHRKYVVKVKAKDPAGNVSRKPAKRRFKVI